MVTTVESPLLLGFLARADGIYRLPCAQVWNISFLCIHLPEVIPRTEAIIPYFYPREFGLFRNVSEGPFVYLWEGACSSSSHR